MAIHTSADAFSSARRDSPTRISDCQKVFDELFSKIDYAAMARRCNNHRDLQPLG